MAEEKIRKIFRRQVIKKMKVTTVLGLYGGCLEDLEVFLDQSKAAEFFAKKMMEYGRDPDNAVRMQTHDVSFKHTGFTRTTDGENILWVLLEEDAQNVAEREFKTKLNTEELLQVQKKLGFGLECWSTVIETAVEAVLEERKKDNEANDKRD